MKYVQITKEGHSEKLLGKGAKVCEIFFFLIAFLWG